MKNKKALSDIVSTLMIILLVIASGAVIFIVVKNMVDKNLSKTSSCYNLNEKITLNNDYTCYNETGNYLKFSISRQEINIDSLLVSILFGDNANVYTITNISQDVIGLSSSSIAQMPISLPGDNSGKPYYAINLTQTPLAIEIAPIINNHNCVKIDEILDIPNCF